MLEDREALRKVIRRVLVPSADDVDGTSLAETSLRAWERVVGQLAPVIGPRGVDALFRRAIHMTKSRFPWLEVTWETKDGAFPAASFLACLSARDPAVAAEGSLELLIAFTELLGTLIGIALTERLLGPIWAIPASPDEKEHTP